jgi:hypothetical protein
MAVRLYEENEVHRCTNCGLTARVTFAAVPIEDLKCCGVETEMVAIQADDTGLDLSPQKQVNSHHPEYKPGEVYWCRVCGIEVEILRLSFPSLALDCCGEGMEKR